MSGLPISILLRREVGDSATIAFFLSLNVCWKYPIKLSSVPNRCYSTDFNIKSFQITMLSKGILKSKTALKMNVSEVTQALFKNV